MQRGGNDRKVRLIGSSPVSFLRVFVQKLPAQTTAEQPSCLSHQGDQAPGALAEHCRVPSALMGAYIERSAVHKCYRLSTMWPLRPTVPFLPGVPGEPAHSRGAIVVFPPATGMQFFLWLSTLHCLPNHPPVPSTPQQYAQ